MNLRILAVLTCGLAASAASHAAFGLKAEYFNGTDFASPVCTRIDETIEFDWGLDRPVEGVQVSAFCVRWTGSVRASGTGRHVFHVIGTHSWRLRVNGRLLVDVLSVKESGRVYDSGFRKPGKWDRLTTSAIPLRAGQRYDITLEYAKIEQDVPSPARVRLVWVEPGRGAYTVPWFRLYPETHGRRPQPAWRARDFYESIGVVFQRATRIPRERFLQQKALLRELGVYTVRLGLFPTAVERKTLDRIPELYRDLGIRSCGLVRESWATSDPAESTRRTVDAIGKVAEAVLFVEGPNEPNLSTERFCYDGHGYDHKTGKKVGDGWQRATAHYIRDLSEALHADPRTAHLKLASSAIAGGGWHPTGSDHWQDWMARADIDLGPYVDYGNIHKYHMLSPASPRFHHMIRGNRRIVGLDRPMVTTETGFNTGKKGHDRVGRTLQAVYTARNYFVTWQADFIHTYAFALLFDEGGKDFGLVNGDGTPKPAFAALKNLIARVRDDDREFETGDLDYRLEGDTRLVCEEVLQKSDGTFVFVVWQEVNGMWNRPKPRTLTLKCDFARAVVYQPCTSAEPIDESGRGNSIRISVPDHPVLVEITRPAQ